MQAVSEKTVEVLGSESSTSRRSSTSDRVIADAVDSDEDSEIGDGKMFARLKFMQVHAAQQQRRAAMHTAQQLKGTSRLRSTSRLSAGVSVAHQLQAPCRQFVASFITSNTCCGCVCAC